MHYLSTLNSKSIQWLGHVMSSGFATSSKFAIAVGYALGSKLSMPAQSVMDARQYYRSTHRCWVLDQMAALNEMLPFNTEEARKFVEDYFTFRYQQAYPKEIPLAFRTDRGVEDFFGLSTCFGQETLDLIKSSPEDISSSISQINTILSALKPKDIERNPEENAEETKYAPEV